MTINDAANGGLADFTTGDQEISQLQEIQIDGSQSDLLSII